MKKFVVVLIIVLLLGHDGVNRLQVVQSNNPGPNVRV